MDFPSIGVIDPKPPAALRSIGSGQHRIYRIEGQTIRIVRLLHQAMDVDRHPDS
ncbi:plasmid stabilization system protein ParE [Sphingomonas vulcanisoli]|uniref:Plasmid stabilization system protein ParE n=1 Tax=Sphingomonas vulcanisoli TaxID=1658060 RepID=A0ABX0TQA3_9SPHN|nr:plasmid stabilization system protein ParE [Sphingomonas vulcanisoli]